MKRLVAIAAALLYLALPVTVAAYNPLDSACGSGGGAAGSTACGTTGNDPLNGPNGAIMKASIVLAAIAGIAAVIIILVSAFRYITANGDTSKAAGARSGIIGAAVGLVIIMAAEGIIVFVISKL